MSITRTKKCRVCGSEHLTTVIDLGEQYLQGSFVFPGKENPTKNKFPTELVLCDASKGGCGLLQMTYSVDPNILYNAYWYRSGINATMRNHLREIVHTAQNLAQKEQLTVLDIGCNDGTLLKAYPDGTKRYGVDPSDVAKTIPTDVATIVSGLFPSAEAQKVFDSNRFDVVTSIAMFYDLEDPVDFASSIKSVLQDDGIWIFEMSYLPLMLIQNSFDTICHEHLEYYSFAVLEKICAKAGMKIFKYDLNDINGGSIRCYATHADNPKFDTVSGEYSLDLLRKSEESLELTNPDTYVAFQVEIQKTKDELVALLDNIKAAGKTVHIYGASTKGNTLLQWYGIDKSVIPYAAERNPDKYGAKTVGTEIEIISEADSRAMKPDYYLVLPWHFKDEFIKREREILEQGSRFIFPLPIVEVVGIEGSVPKEEWV